MLASFFILILRELMQIRNGFRHGPTTSGPSLSVVRSPRTILPTLAGDLLISGPERDLFDSESDFHENLDT